jgi:dTDP-4-dehydrorhamnose reductase
VKFLVLGSNGMAGHVIALHLQEQGYEVDTVARSAGTIPPTQILDVTDFPRLDDVLTSKDYDVVVNCVGLLIEASQQDPAAATLVNAYLPQHLARTLGDSATRLIHLSTDCVFSGANGPYAETAPYDGQRVYDRTKALGEVVNDKDLTLRMSIIGPELTSSGAGLFHWFSQQRGHIRGFTGALWNGVTTPELAHVVEALSSGSFSGLVHAVPSESVSKHELLIRLNDTFAHGLTVEPWSGHQADKRLLRTRANIATDVRGYDAMLEDLRCWIARHVAVYPHYSHLVRSDA